MIKQELDALKYELYKKSGKADYITYKQFVENNNVAYTFSELQKKKPKRAKNGLTLKSKKIQNRGNM